MCINLQTSITAFLIGEISGFLLTRVSEDRKPLGYFVMFFSLVQLCEAVIYYNYSYELSNFFHSLLLINLGFQGLVFFILMNKIFIIPNIYFILTIIVAFFSIYIALISHYDKDIHKKNKCFKWIYSSKYTKYIIVFMYLLIFYWIFNKKIGKRKNIEISYDFYYKASIIFIGTFIISVLLSNKCYPSFWCLISALASPLLLII
jgi:uncharacterized membrane protein